MLKKVLIQNFGLVKNANLEFKSGFTAITGETGAGKSFFTQALRLGFGGRAKDKSEKKSIIEIEFQDHIFRRILEEKKSRFFINDIPETGTVGQEFTNEHIDFHGQNDHLFLKKPESAGILLDNSLENKMIKSEFLEKFQDFQTIKRKLKNLKKEFSEFESQREFWEFQTEKMSSINFSLEDLNHAEIEVSAGKKDLQLKPLIQESIEILAGEENSILAGLDRAENLLADIDSQMAKKIRPFFTEISEIVQDLEKKVPEENYELEIAQDLILKVHKWQKKFSVSSPEALLDKKISIHENLKYLKNLEIQIQDTQTLLEEKEVIALKYAEKLSEERKKIQKKFGEKIQEKCRNLGMLPAQFVVKLKPQTLSSKGMEHVEFYFSANKSQILKPLKQTASGGEIARITLALKHFYPNMSTMIFDEIDTGVSGSIAEKMAEEMKILSQDKQILSITHLPQIAAKADYHYIVEKTHFDNFTETTIREIKGVERIKVIASMLSGKNITEEATKAAQRLMDK